MQSNMFYTHCMSSVEDTARKGTERYEIGLGWRAGCIDQLASDAEGSSTCWFSMITLGGGPNTPNTTCKPKKKQSMYLLIWPT